MNTNGISLGDIKLQLTEKYGFSDALVEEIMQRSVLKQYPRGGYLKTSENIERKIRMICSGIGGYFTTKPSGEELCFYFALPGEVFFDTKSVVDNAVTNIELKALKEMIVIEIEVNQLSEILKKYPQGENVIRKSIEILFSDTMDQYLQLLTLTATQRYELFLKRYKNYSLYIEDQYIASYLGIAPQSLCRLKRILFHRNS